MQAISLSPGAFVPAASASSRGARLATPAKPLSAAVSSCSRFCFGAGLKVSPPVVPLHPNTGRAGRRSVAMSAATSAPSDSDILAAAEAWLSLDGNADTCAEAEALVAAGDAAELRKRFGERLAFGTAGLRGLMGAGYSRMNTVTVQQTTQGLCTYLLEEAQEQVMANGVAIGYDGRHGSMDFATIAASVFISKGIKVHLFSTLAATPLVAMAVAHYGCAAGVMVTASHNPKEYNGYKVYWGNGCQIIPPHDAGIAAAIEANLELWELPPSDGPLLVDPTAEVSEEYYKQLGAQLNFDPAASASASPVVYTPLHGVGLPWAARAFDVFGLPPFQAVKAQAKPDPEFPTVVFPNPEEGEGTWKMAFDTGEEAGCDIVIANDPDADRLAAAEWDAEAGKYRAFSGNEIGALLAHWVWTKWREANPDADAAKAVMLASTVSSKMLKSMAAAEGFRFEETLTGFKWLGNRAMELEDEGLTPLFAFEEAIGFCFPGMHKDKDGVSAAAVFAQMAAALKARGTTVRAHLEALFAKYGHHAFRGSYFIAQDPSDSAAVFDRLREGGKYPTDIGPCKVASVRDLGTGLDTSAADGKASLFWEAGDMMITFSGDGFTLTLRASGTEPKLKYYLEVVGDDAAKAEALADAMVEGVEAIVMPEKHNLSKPAN